MKSGRSVPWAPLVAIVVLLLPACGGRDSTPTAPSTPTVPSSCATPSAPATLRASVVGFTVTLSWSAVPNATSYIVEIGSVPGVSNLEVIDTQSSDTSFDWHNVARGSYFIRVKARNDCGTAAATTGGPSNEVTVDVPAAISLDRFTQDYIEALFLGTGPLIPRDGFTACIWWPGTWAGSPRGTTIRVRVSTSVSLEARNMIRRALGAVPEATHGAISTTFETTTDPDPFPGFDEATATDHPDPISQNCTFERGCVIIGWRGDAIVQSSRTVLKQAILPADAFVHDLVGHGVMGMCHIDAMLIGGTGNSLMSGGPGAYSGHIADELSPLDIRAARAVFGSSLNPGATRDDFIRVGLINGGGGGATRRE